MRQSHLFTKARKESPKDEVSKNAQLLIRAGFINKEMAGVYSYLPLGLRVLKKVEQIIREEMNAIGGQEVLLTSLQDPEVWKKTDRWSDEAMDVWFKTALSNGQELGIATTHEEPLTQLMSQHLSSYKDMPRYVYQFQTKFRNELRAKSGLMRGREFIMKDMYSFTKNEEDFKAFYEQCADAYLRIFDRVGLGDKTFRTFASGGSFSKFSDEFQTLSDAGEDTVYLHREKGIAVNKEVYTDDVLSELGLEKSELEEVKAIEVGNIFPLGTKFSKPLGLEYADESGAMHPVIMGSYGIGLGRVMGTVAEVHADENGLVWPSSIAPFQIHIVSLCKEEENKKKAEQIYRDLLEKGVEVLFDDREDVRPGQKFAESDLMGIPTRIVLSEKTLEKNEMEVKKRTESDPSFMPVTNIDSLVT